MNNQNEIPNHFKRVEDLLERRRKVLAGFDGCPQNEIYGRLQGEANFIFYKAIVAEMRSIVEAYDYEFNRTEADNDD